MDEEEIDFWYEEEKQKFMEEYLAEIRKGINHDQAEKTYRSKLNKLIEKYNNLLLKNIVHTKNINDLKKNIKNQLDEIKKKVPFLKKNAI